MGFQMSFDDFLKGDSVFSHREESELLQAKKKIKNAMMSCIFNRYSLSCREVEVYKLFHYQGLNHRQIANLLNIKRTTSRNYLYRANKKINKISKKMEGL